MVNYCFNCEAQCFRCENEWVIFRNTICTE